VQYAIEAALSSWYQQC